jgi:phage terminase small subunit
MPRISSEARATLPLQPAHEPPKAPAHLSAAAKRLWDEVVLDRPQDHFRPGSMQLLASFCEVTSVLDRLWKAEVASRGDPERHSVVVRRICSLAATQARLCGDLRLTPRANVERHSAKRDARGLWTRDPLLQGKKAVLDS